MHLTGELVQTLFEEKSEKYVEPEHRLIFEEAFRRSFYLV